MRTSSSFGDADVLRWARRAWCERVRADGDVVVDATLGRLRLERQVAEALAAIGMQQP